MKGFISKEDWTGDPEKWVSEEVWTEKGEKIDALYKPRFEKAEARIAQLEASNAEFGEFARGAQQRTEKERDDVIAELRAQKAKAIDDAEGAEVVRIEREIEKLERVPTNGVQINPAQQQWLRDNQWYDNTSNDFDPEMYEYAEDIHLGIMDEGYRAEGFGRELTRRVKKKFSDKFENPKKKGSNTVEKGGELEKKDLKARTYDNLPAYAKEACDNFIRDGVIKDKEDYAKNFEWNKADV